MVSLVLIVSTQFTSCFNCFRDLNSHIGDITKERGEYPTTDLQFCAVSSDRCFYA